MKCKRCGANVDSNDPEFCGMRCRDLYLRETRIGELEKENAAYHKCIAELEGKLDIIIREARGEPADSLAADYADPRRLDLSDEVQTMRKLREARVKELEAEHCPGKGQCNAYLELCQTRWDERQRAKKAEAALTELEAVREKREEEIAARNNRLQVVLSTAQLKQLTAEAALAEARTDSTVLVVALERIVHHDGDGMIEPREGDDFGPSGYLSASALAQQVLADISSETKKALDVLRAAEAVRAAFDEKRTGDQAVVETVCDARVAEKLPALLEATRARRAWESEDGTLEA